MIESTILNIAFYCHTIFVFIFLPLLQLINRNKLSCFFIVISRVWLVYLTRKRFLFSCIYQCVSYDFFSVSHCTIQLVRYHVISFCFSAGASPYVLSLQRTFRNRHSATFPGVYLSCRVYSPTEQ